MIVNAQETLIENWGEDGKRVIEECAKVTPFNDESKKFLDNCTCCGGDWGAMLLSGIKKLYPNVWEAIPDDMGIFVWGCICNTLILCGVDTSR
jgi:hypothetical protein